MKLNRLALYTTVYPGVEKYLSDWYESVLAQTDSEFDIWIGIDELAIEEVKKSVGHDLSAKWVMAAEGVSPASLRGEAISQMVAQYSAVIFTDGDDLLHPTRVEAARKALKRNDVNGCAMHVIDKCGCKQERIFAPPVGESFDTILPKYNVFGLTNTAYRSEILYQCMPIPSECVLIDWFLITCAWNIGACLSFDYKSRMTYYQHVNTLAQVLPPFSQKQVLQATDLVLDHYYFALDYIPELKPWIAVKLRNARYKVELFSASMRKSTYRLDKYIDALNGMPPTHIWWSCVAHPDLEDIWRK